MTPRKSSTFCHTDTWVFRKCRLPENEVKLRLFLFPPAGSDISVYYKWEEYLPAEVEACFIRLPGRGGRINDPPISDCDKLASKITDGISKYFNVPYAFFGHSMGALIAYETTVQIKKRGLRLPERLFLSSLKAPNEINSKSDCFAGIMETDDNQLHLLNDEDLKNKLYEIGGIPDIILENSDFVDMLIPVFRNDLYLCETYETNAVVKLPVPIDAYGGISDKIASREDLEAWRDCSDKELTITMFPGGHFYFNSANRMFYFNLSKRLEEIITSKYRKKDGSEESRKFATAVPIKTAKQEIFVFPPEMDK